jgi:1-acyl-sn-glycerol-3-phosphate acyltransferase
MWTASLRHSDRGVDRDCEGSLPVGGDPVSRDQLTVRVPAPWAPTRPDGRAAPVAYHAPMATEDRIADLQTPGALVPLPRAVTGEEPLDDPRLSDVDEWGRSERVRALARRLYDPLYRRWFRAEWEGMEKVPTDGGALLVCNHSGAIPSDAPVIMHGIETEMGRPVYGLAEHIFKTLPVIGTMWNRVGGVGAHPDNAYRLLREQQQLALVFPEGTKATSKPLTQRYQLRRFGRGGFVEIAMRAGVPVIPIAVIGSEEAMPIVFNVPGVAKALGVPYVPVTANMLLFGPLGGLLYFPAKIRVRVLDPVHFDVPSDQERYSRSRIMDESEAIRGQIQDNLYDMLRKRKSVWFG